MLEDVIAKLDAMVASWLRPPSTMACYSANEEGKEAGYHECAQELYQLIGELQERNQRDYLK